MLIMILGTVQQLNHNDATEWLQPYWGVLKTWADFLKDSLPDPGNQLCTDDFEGPNPHNANLAAKGIVALAAYAELLDLKGQSASAASYRDTAKALATAWIGLASSTEAGFKRQFDLRGSWSQKYNLIWQRALSLHGPFLEMDLQREAASYSKRRCTYGIPLDDRHNYTKADWSMWAAALGTQEQFQAAVGDLYRFVQETPDRVPFTDWYDTHTAKAQGFRARPVMGGIYIGLLTSPPEQQQSIPSFQV